MNIKSFNKAILLILGAITILIWSLLIWDYLHGGVPAHHLLANKDLPKISNWWGAVTVPFTSFLLLSSLKKRITFENDQVPAHLILKECYSFFAAMLYAVILSVSFALGNTQISGLLFLGLPLTALFFPIYRSSYFLGFLVGMMYTFGGVLPVIIGTIMSIICYLLFILFHPPSIKSVTKTTV